MRYRLRTLLIVLALGPPLLAGAWWTRQRILERQRQARFDEVIDLINATVPPDSWKTDDLKAEFIIIPVAEPEPKSP